MQTKCPQCGANITIDILSALQKCEYCGHTIVDESPNGRELLRLAQDEARCRKKLATALEIHDYRVQYSCYKYLAEHFPDKESVFWHRIWNVLIGENILDKSLINLILEDDKRYEQVKQLIAELADIKVIGEIQIAYQAFEHLFKIEHNNITNNYLQTKSFKKPIKKSINFYIAIILGAIIGFIAYLGIADLITDIVIASVATVGIYLILFVCTNMNNADNCLFKVSGVAGNKKQIACYVYQDGIVIHYTENNTIQVIYFRSMRSLNYQQTDKLILGIDLITSFMPVVLTLDTNSIHSAMDIIADSESSADDELIRYCLSRIR